MPAARLVFLTLLVACSSPAATPAAADAAADAAQALDTADAAEVDAADPFAGAPPAVCRPATPWSGNAAFTEITAQTGVGPTGLGVAGIRLSTADVDGDLYPELAVRRHVAGKRDAPGARTAWLLRNEAKGGTWTFSDATQPSGILATRDGQGGRPAHVVVFGDADNDGDVDVFAGATISPDPKVDVFPTDASELLVNDGTGKFSLQKDNPFAAKDLRRSLTSASFVDYDRDGALDLWLGYATWGSPSLPIPDQLLRGDGQGGWQTVTVDEGLMTLPWANTDAVLSGAAHRHTWGTAACDVNGDGHPDLLSQSYGRYFNGLWLGGGVGGSGMRFSDLQAETGYGRDDDDDWTSNLNAQCYCQENPEAAECDKAPAPAIDCAKLKAAFKGSYRWNHGTDRLPFRLGGNTGTGLCADLDRDGDLDLVDLTIVHSDVGASSDPSHVLRNPGGLVPKFEHLDVEATGLGRTWPDAAWNAGDMTGAPLDFDNDGRLDLLIASSDYPGTRAFLFRQLDTGKFELVPPAQGIDHLRAHGVAVADFDRDGDLDVVLGHSVARCSPGECQPTEQIRVWRNDVGQAGNFVQVRLVGGPGSNRSAIGARVRVTAGGVTQTQEVGGGYGHYGQQQDLVLHFGLGAACAIDAVEVRWPDAAGTIETWPHVRANYLVQLQQGQGQPAYPLVQAR